MRFVKHKIDRATSHRIRAVLDFGSSGARAVVVRVKNDAVEVLGAIEVKGRSGIARPGQVMRREQIAALVEEALSAAERDTIQDAQGPFIADEAIVGLTGPYLMAESNTNHLQRYNPIAPIYEPEILDALEAVQRRNLQAITNTRVEALPIRHTLIASQLVGAMSIRQDTRQVELVQEAFRGVPALSGDVLAIAICNLLWPRQGLEVLIQVLDDLELNLLQAIPLAQAVSMALPVPEAILIDMGYEHSEIALVERARLSNLANIPLGGHFFTQALMEQLHLSQKQAELIKREHTRSKGRSGGRPVSRVLGQAAKIWHQQIEHTLLNLAGDAPLPPRLYLFGGGALLPEVFEQLRAQPWTKRLPFDQHPTVERLLPHHLQGVYDPRGLLTTSSQVGVAALAAWAGSEPSSLQSHLTKISKRLANEFNLI